MTNAKTTRKALVSSMVALLICFAMLLGTTFAWFTDSVSSTNNIIKSGNLDVELYWTDSLVGEVVWNDASEGAIFDYQLWEPGYTQVKYLKLVNDGNLAFKYQINVIPDILNVEDIYGVDLAEVIDVYTVYADANNYPTSLSDMVKMGTLSDLMADKLDIEATDDYTTHGGRTPSADTGVLLPVDSTGAALTGTMPDGTEYYTGSVVVCVALHMQETADNRYQNVSVGEGFSVQVLASQFTYENDSFGNTYDEGTLLDANQAIPIAEVTYASELVGVSTAGLPWLNSSPNMVYANTGVVFDTAYHFVAPVSDTIVDDSPYADYIADYAICFDAEITPEMEIGIAGYYDFFTSWVGFLANEELLGETTLEANTFYDLLAIYGLDFSYDDICTLVRTFTCSAWGGEKAEGVTLTVELRLYEKLEDGHRNPDSYIVIGSYDYTFTGE